MPAHTFQEIPILNLKDQHQHVAGAVEEAVIQVLRNGSYILGVNVAKLEEKIANLLGVKHAIAVANGTDALVLALWALNIGLQDEVIVPAFTFAATAEAVALRGATPVFIDVEPNTFNINPNLVAKAITPKTKAIIPVHLYGQPAGMDAILTVANRFGLQVIEDNAQAIGATYKGTLTGNLGDIACLSFYPTKNLGAYGDAGMVVTNDATLANRITMLRAHGCQKRYIHEELGVNSRLDEVQAAALLAKLPYLVDANKKRNQIAKWYSMALGNTAGLVVPYVMPEAEHVWHQYTIRITQRITESIAADDKALHRDNVIEELAKRGIGTMCYYPVPLHLQPAFAYLGYQNGNFPVAEALAKEVLSLPMYPELTEDQVDYVAKNLIDILVSKDAKIKPMPQIQFLAGSS